MSDKKRAFLSVCNICFLMLPMIILCFFNDYLNHKFVFIGLLAIQQSVFLFAAAREGWSEVFLVLLQYLGAIFWSPLLHDLFKSHQALLYAGAICILTTSWYQKYRFLPLPVVVNLMQVLNKREVTNYANIMQLVCITLSISLYYFLLWKYFNQFLRNSHQRRMMKTYTYNLFRAVSDPDKVNTIHKLKAVQNKLAALHTNTDQASLREDVKILQKVTMHMINIVQYQENSSFSLDTLNHVNLLYNDLVMLINSSCYLKTFVFQYHMFNWNRRLRAALESAPKTKDSNIIYEVCTSGVAITKYLATLREKYENQA